MNSIPQLGSCTICFSITNQHKSTGRTGKETFTHQCLEAATLHELEYRTKQDFIITIIKLDSAQKGAPRNQIYLKLLLVMHTV